jgi:Polyketide cyclase / dehydrase and lipid transport
MQVIKLGLISVVVFALMITGISLFFPSHVRISKAIDINAPKDSVWAQISDAANWKNWYPGGDSLPQLIVDGKIKGIGADSMQALQITMVTDTTVTASAIDPLAKKSESGWNIFSSNTPNTVTIQWYTDFHLRWYPWEKFSSLLLEKRYGPMMEQGLSNLKSFLEK